MLFKGPTWLKSVHCIYMLKLSLKLAIKGQGDPLIVKPQTTNQCIMCMSVQCVHGTQGEPGNVAMSIAYLQF